MGLDKNKVDSPPTRPPEPGDAEASTEPSSTPEPGDVEAPTESSAPSSAPDEQGVVETPTEPVTAAISSIEQVVARRLDHAMKFRERFPNEAARLDTILSAAKRFSPMLLGADPGMWTPDDERIAEILNDAVKDLHDAVEELYLGRLKFSMVAIRCFLEQLFFSLYYREQAIEFALWQRSHREYVMLHQLYDSKHPFRKFFQDVFKDRRDAEWQQQKQKGSFSKKIFEDLEKLYSLLSLPVHGRPNQRESTPGLLSASEVGVFCRRLSAAVSIAMEFFDIAGTGAESPPTQFRYTSSTAVE